MAGSAPEPAGARRGTATGRGPRRGRSGGPVGARPGAHPRPAEPAAAGGRLAACRLAPSGGAAARGGARAAAGAGRGRHQQARPGAERRLQDGWPYAPCRRVGHQRGGRAVGGAPALPADAGAAARPRTRCCAAARRLRRAGPAVAERPSRCGHGARRPCGPVDGPSTQRPAGVVRCCRRPCSVVARPGCLSRFRLVGAGDRRPGGPRPGLARGARPSPAGLGGRGPGGSRRGAGGLRPGRRGAVGAARPIVCTG